MGKNYDLKPFSLLNNSYTLLNAGFNERERAHETHISKEAGITNSDIGKKNYKNLRFTSVSLKHVPGQYCGVQAQGHCSGFLPHGYSPG
jgi:hypothetical protein